MCRVVSIARLTSPCFYPQVPILQAPVPPRVFRHRQTQRVPPKDVRDGQVLAAQGECVSVSVSLSVSVSVCLCVCVSVSVFAALSHSPVTQVPLPSAMQALEEALSNLEQLKKDISDEVDAANAAAAAAAAAEAASTSSSFSLADMPPPPSAPPMPEGGDAGSVGAGAGAGGGAGPASGDAADAPPPGPVGLSKAEQSLLDSLKHPSVRPVASTALRVLCFP